MNYKNLSIMLHWEDEKRNKQYKMIDDKNYGFEIVAFSHHSVWEQPYQSNINKYKSELNKYKNSYISFHGPIADIIPHSEVSAIANLAKDRIEKSIEIALELNANRIVFHTGINAIISDPNYIGYVINRQTEFWSNICDKYKGIDIVIENMWEKDYSYILEICNKVNKANFGFCLDIGHVNVYSKLSSKEWIDNLRPHLKHIHLNDNNGTWDEHLALGRGNINWNDWLEKLKAINDLQYVLELTELVDIENSIKQLEIGYQPLLI